MLSFIEYLIEADDEEIYGWLDHNFKFRKNYHRGNKGHTYSHAGAAARYFKLKTAGKAIDHAIKHGWTRIYQHGNDGVAHYDSSKIHDRKAHRKTLRTLFKRITHVNDREE